VIFLMDRGELFDVARWSGESGFRPVETRMALFEV
jgi:hypothetical protein